MPAVRIPRYISPCCSLYICFYKLGEMFDFYVERGVFPEANTSCRRLVSRGSSGSRWRKTGSFEGQCRAGAQLTCSSLPSGEANPY